MSPLKLCVIIATMNRPKDLDITLKSIVESSTLPHKLLIVDDSDNYLTQNVVNKYTSEFAEIKIEYIHPIYEQRSLTKARNIGLSRIDDCDIVLYLDDDVTLDPKYLEILINTFEMNPTIDGFQGYIEHSYHNRNLLFKLAWGVTGSFFPALSRQSFYTPVVNRILINKYPLFIPKINKIRKCHWLSGANMAYRASIFRDQKLKFNENFILYCLFEDLDFSYELFKNNQKLVINFDARLIHRVSEKARIQKKSRLLMEFGYKKYLISKFISNTAVNKLIYKIYCFHFLFSQLVLSLIFRKNLMSFEIALDSYQIVNSFEDQLENLNLSSLNNAILNFISS